MKNQSISKSLAALLFCAICTPAFAEAGANAAANAQATGLIKGADPSAPSLTAKNGWEKFYDSFIRDRLEIGLRWDFRSLDNPTKWDAEKNWGFVGTISELQEKDPSFANIYIGYSISEWFGLGLTWDSLKATAHTGYTIDGHNDGDFVTEGPTLTAVFTVPGILDDKLVPYAEVGAYFVSAEFDAAYWWEYGYALPAAYQELGSPKDYKPRNGKHRIIDTKESTKLGFVYGIGVKYYFTNYLCLDLAYRHINAEASAHYYMQIGNKVVIDHEKQKIPMDHSVFSVGLRYAF